MTMYSIPEQRPQDIAMFEKDNMALLLASSLISYCAARCKWFLVYGDHPITTAAAAVTPTGNEIYLNMDFLGPMTNKQRAYVMYHEVLHIFLEHTSRRTQLFAKKGLCINEDVWAVAIDAETNCITSGHYIDGDGNKQQSTALQKWLNEPEGGIFMPEHAGKSAETIYEELMAQQGSDKQERASGMYGKGFDSHPEGSGSGGSALSPEEREAIQAQMDINRQTMGEAIATAKSNKQIGDHEAQIVNQFDELVKPVVRWQDKLSKQISVSVKEYSTYNRVSRRSTQEIMMPSYMGSHLNIVYGVDSSGSMSHDDYVRSFSELVGVLESYDSWTIRLITCDTVAHFISEITSEDYSSPVDIEFNTKGGGGTDMYPLVQYAIDLEHNGDFDPDMLIIATDGHIPENLDNGYRDFDTTVIVTESGNKELAFKNSTVVHVNN